jgi:molybdopterin-binding protein
LHSGRASSVASTPSLAELTISGTPQPEKPMAKYGARNVITGEITEMKKGSVMCEVKLKVPAEARMASVMTLESADDLALKVGDKVQIVVKAINVLLVKE